MLSGSADAQAAGKPRTGTASLARAVADRAEVQSISEHEPPRLRFARQAAMQFEISLVDADWPMYWMNGWSAHFACTAASSFVQRWRRPTLSSQPRNRPPPQMHSICGSHSLGHQQASLLGRAAIARLHAFALAPSREHGIVVVAPPCPPWPVTGPLPVDAAAAAGDRNRQQAERRSAFARRCAWGAKPAIHVPPPTAGDH